LFFFKQTRAHWRPGRHGRGHGNLFKEARRGLDLKKPPITLTESNDALAVVVSGRLCSGMSMHLNARVSALLLLK